MEQRKEEKKTQKETEEKINNELVKKDKVEIKTIPKDPLMAIESEVKATGLKDDEPTSKQEDKGFDIEALKVSLDDKTKLADDYYDRLMRIQAEFDNYQKRAEKEKEDFRNYANAQLIKDLLGILDDFQNALSIKEEGSNREFLRGFEMIYENLLGMLKKEGLCIIKAESEKFDPWKHEAVEMVPTKEHPDHTVLSVIQPGYMFKDKILRPAKVRVAIGPSVEENKEDNGDKDSESGENEED
ncbi:MAG: nucleotide exchange factor GrpE [Thermoplasmata archaeon]|nr:MAG: nucleotide exchange factor GrpE [Thermoplasmata archaeon]